MKAPLLQRQELRRVYQSGLTSVALTLPSGWVRQVGLRGGSVVEIIVVENGDLIVHPKPIAGSKGESAKTA